jgi:hypothetical protein
MQFNSIDNKLEKNETFDILFQPIQNFTNETSRRKNLSAQDFIYYERWIHQKLVFLLLEVIELTMINENFYRVFFDKNFSVKFIF